MRLATPFSLVLFVVLAGILWVLFKFIFGKRVPTVSFSVVGQVKDAQTTDNRIFYIFPAVLRTVALGLLIFALARPQFGRKTEEVHTYGVDIVLCMDTSGSMRAEDFKPRNRLYVAKEVAGDFVKARKNDRIGIVVFGGISFTQCPLTVDHGAILDFMDNIEVGMTQTQNTAIGSGIVTALNRLKDSNAKSKIIILLTDGRNNAGDIDPITAAKTASNLNVKIYSIGVGGIGPAPYPVEDPVFGKRYTFINEDLDEGTLKEIAAITGGRYFRATSKEALKDVYKQIDKLEKSEIKKIEFVDYNDLYLPYLFVSFILLFSEFLFSNVIKRRVP